MTTNLQEDCLETHDQRYGNNYVWLEALGHGSVINVWFEEPVGSSNFQLYTTNWWRTHCEMVSHGDDLLEAHVEAFVNPETRFARMLFHFEDGSLIEATEKFYQLEQEYYDRYIL
ncbi:Hypothetical protein POVR1_LOCUS202 [uncultured virus]|nr:Hypothetical protein POVR1_LOCUS202 [uncultured virus]